MDRKNKYIAGISIIILVVLLVIWSNPLRRSEERIRERMLLITPIGISVNNVIATIESNEWEIWYVRNHGFELLEGRPKEPASRETQNIVGEHSIRASIGYYYNFVFQTWVVVFWGFDENFQLIDIAVRKDAK